jgi:Icc-related predicted phosphoesterase
MKFLFVSDLHYALKQLDWLTVAVEYVDLLVIGGDLLDISATVDAHVQIVVILKYLRQLNTKTRVIVCSGNHDLDAHNEDGEKYARWIGKANAFGAHTDLTCVDFAGTLFTICPWWDGPKTRDRVAAQLARDAGKPKQRWIWVYHSPPADSPTSWVGKRHVGDQDLSAWIASYSPDIVLTGHIHQSPFVRGGSWVDRIGSTWIFNPGRQIGPHPTRILFDEAASTAAWISLAGAEVVNLDAPLTRPIPQPTDLPAWAI